MNSFLVTLITGLILANGDCNRSLDEGVVSALIEWESGGNSSLEGTAGDRGLMQVTHQALRHYNSIKGHEQVGYDELFQSSKNIKVGVWLLCYCINKESEDVKRGLMRYHGGGRAMQRNRDKSRLEKYAEGVLGIYNKALNKERVAEAMTK